MLIYLDSSAIVKRYIEEEGTETIDDIFDNAEKGKVKIFFSLWNVGEAIGVFDKYKRRDLIGEDELEETLGKFAGEFIKLARIDQLELIPLHTNLVTDSIEIILKYHIYEGDAIQVISSKHCNCDLFLTADKQLVEVARDLRIEAFNIEKEETSIKNALTFKD